MLLELLLYTTHRHRNKESLYVNTIANGLSDGVLLMIPLIQTEYLHALRERNFPYVMIDQTDNDNLSNIVDATNWQGAYDATQYLIQLGHIRIAFIKGSSVVRSAEDRLQGYKAALADYGISVLDELIIEGDFQQQTAYESAQRLLQSQQTIPRPKYLVEDGYYEHCACWILYI